MKVSLNVVPISARMPKASSAQAAASRELLLKDQDELDYLVARRSQIEAYEAATAAGARP